MKKMRSNSVKNLLYLKLLLFIIFQGVIFYYARSYNRYLARK